MAEIVINSKKHGVHVVLVDDEDFNKLNKFRWHLRKHRNTFYASRQDKTGKRAITIEVHRMVLGLQLGDGLMVDHKNHNGLDNRKCNLRIVTSFQNQQNKTSKINSSSKYLGVSWDKRANKWRADIKINNKTIYLGYFKIEEEAALAYNEASIKYYGEYANPNKI